ncbi:MAG: YbhB/YbcL family Raf kinase inhibitor-like protein [Candidatus Rehaiarchaeum fermentans]|nr:YbhB/YbcL family Raf kinase inhibitor-like protein [Candidatus Rehaiarchaeum fermentans]MCW1302048.1 YbhB/YbcL family Raf kinase inhibitor-like protein [Candidatus Rehaiarchaeum fermentans]
MEIIFPDIKGDYFPKEYTLEGENISPRIEWSKNGAYYALIMEDPDAPGGTFTHWLIFNIEKNFLEKGIPRNYDKAIQLINDFGRRGYDGPFPPKGHGVHHYYFKVFSLSSKLPSTIDSKEELLREINKVLIEKGEKILLYKRD